MKRLHSSQVRLIGTLSPSFHFVNKELKLNDRKTKCLKRKVKINESRSASYCCIENTEFCSAKSILFAARNTDNSGDFTKIYQILRCVSIVNRIQKTYFCPFRNCGKDDEMNLDNPIPDKTVYRINPVSFFQLSETGSLTRRK
jgi:hypothetical protein